MGRGRCYGICLFLNQRNHLFKEYLRFVDAFAPRAILIENVHGLVFFEHGATLHAILNTL